MYHPPIVSVLSGVRRRDQRRSRFTNQPTPAVELLAAPHQEAIWPSKPSGLCSCVCSCFANKGMTDVPHESPPLLLVSFFIHLPAALLLGSKC